MLTIAPAALARHVAQRGARHAHRAGQRDVEHREPLLVGHVGERGGAAEPGVVDEHVELPAAELDRFVDEPLHVVFDGHVAEHRVRVRTEAIERLWRRRSWMSLMTTRAPSSAHALRGREADAGAGRGGDRHRLAREQVPARRVRRRGRDVLIVAPSASPRACSPITLRWIWFEPP